MKQTIGKAVFGLLFAGALSFGATQAVADAAQQEKASRACPSSCHQYCRQTFCPNGPPCTGYCDFAEGACVCYYP
ncbi:MAG TPA: hypothetical protein VF541_21450 [Longimicrobium sp.]|jgi:hypothetical protein